MSRVWIDFIHSQDIMNSKVSFGNKLFDAKILADGLTTESGINASVDGVGRTYLLTLKPGDFVESFVSKEHIRAFSLSGDIQIGDTTFPEWLFLEGGIGSKFPKIQAISEVELFVSTNSWSVEIDFYFNHFSNVDWTEAVVKELPGGAARKALGDHDDFGAAVLGVLPGWNSPFTEFHTFSEEIFQIQGTMSTTFGVMTPGSYLSHPRGDDTIHGPVFSKTGGLMLVLRHGQVGNTYLPADPDEIARVRNL